MQKVDTVVVGAGPAGVAAAIQLQRFCIPHVLLEKGVVGGLLRNANLIENYPGFPKGVGGIKLSSLLERQLAFQGVRPRREEVTSVTERNGRYEVTSSEHRYLARFVVVASGTEPLPVPVPIPPGLEGRVGSEVYPVLGVHGKQVVIVGAGDAAFDYALNLIKNRNSVTILNRGVTVKCLQVLWQRAAAESLLCYRPDVSILQLTAEDTPRPIGIRLTTGEDIRADYLLFAIGRQPQVGFLPAAVIKRQPPGLVLIGDVKNGMYRQAAIAAGEGLRAAMRIYFELKAEGRTP